LLAILPQTPLQEKAHHSRDPRDPRRAVRLTSDGGRTHTWNARDQLSALSAVPAAAFAYDGLGRRIQKTVAGVTTNLVYDGLNVTREIAGVTTTHLFTG
jgi:hypothetical protein